MENMELLLKILTLAVAIITAFITTKVTISYILKIQDEHSKRLDKHEGSINSLQSEIEHKLSYKVADERYVGRKELDLRLEMVALKQQTSLDKTDEILKLLKDKEK